MQIVVSESRAEMGARAAAEGADAIRTALAAGSVDINIIVATGTSQFEVLADLAKSPNIPWNRVTIFHLDEYVGLPETHPASFRKYLRERFIDQLPDGPKAFHAINAEQDAESEIARLSELIDGQDVVVAFIGIGENGHLAFNDPPADFVTEEPYLLVNLDEACRRQQLGEGWFPSLEAVPTRAISMSVRQILKAKRIICSVPDERKAAPVRDAIEGPIAPELPASILQQHANTTLYLDKASASLLAG
jgi:glucosamine-6-phosphate deaminase